jgi:hypothetical protein
MGARFNGNWQGYFPKSTIVESFTPFVFRCFTFLSDLIEKQNFTKYYHNNNSWIKILNSLDLPFIIHSPKIPPYLFTEVYRYYYNLSNVNSDQY